MFKNKGKWVLSQKYIIAVFCLLLATNAEATSIGPGCGSDGSSDDACAITEMGFMRKSFDVLDFDSIVDKLMVGFSHDEKPRHLRDNPRFSVGAGNHGKDKSGIDLAGPLSVLFDHDSAGFDDARHPVKIDDRGMGHRKWRGEHGGHFNITHPRHHGHDSVPAVPVPAAVWLFGSGLLVLAGVIRRRA